MTMMREERRQGGDRRQGPRRSSDLSSDLLLLSRMLDTLTEEKIDKINEKLYKKREETEDERRIGRDRRSGLDRRAAPQDG
jgi:hypothetical protein